MWAACVVSRLRCLTCGRTARTSSGRWPDSVGVSLLGSRPRPGGCPLSLLGLAAPDSTTREKMVAPASTRPAEAQRSDRAFNHRFIGVLLPLCGRPRLRILPAPLENDIQA